MIGILDIIIEIVRENNKYLKKQNELLREYMGQNSKALINVNYDYATINRGGLEFMVTVVINSSTEFEMIRIELLNDDEKPMFELTYHQIKALSLDKNSIGYEVLESISQQDMASNAEEDEDIQKQIKDCFKIGEK